MKILLSGATGYIGGRLCERLSDEKDIRVFVRSTKKVKEEIKEKVEIAKGDTFDIESLHEALDGIDVAYYLIHSMGSGEDFEKLDRLSAENFRDACIDAGVKRIVYLGGLGVKETASKHLASRIETGEILSEYPDKIQTIWFRAAIIIGKGSASFEIIRNLVKKLPIMTTPKWINTCTQPISVEDVIEYLSLANELDFKENLMVDIGSQAMSFKKMLEETSEVMGKKRYIIPLPVLTPRLSSYWLAFISTVPQKIAIPLVDGLKSETVLQNDNANKYFPSIKPMKFKDAVRIALKKD
jgi:uncharacterized protein YbjT (DUF2867 family)